MYKLKTHSGAKKRFKKLKSGLIKCSHSFHRHLLTDKSSKRKRHLRKPMYLTKSAAEKMAILMPY